MVRRPFNIIKQTANRQSRGHQVFRRGSFFKAAFLSRGFFGQPSLDFLEQGLVQDENVIEDEAAQDHSRTTGISQDEQNDGIDEDRGEEKEMNDGEDRIAER